MSGEKRTIGWREWVGLPDLGVKRIKAKVDTGARTSALHAEGIEHFRRGERRFVRFTIYPLQRSKTDPVVTTARLIDERTVTSSNGVRELRPVIETELEIGGERWPIELTLTSRDVMGFRMLLGRQAVRGQVVIDPGRSFVTRKRKKKKRKRLSGERGPGREQIA